MRNCQPVFPKWLHNFTCWPTKHLSSSLPNPYSLSFSQCWGWRPGPQTHYKSTVPLRHTSEPLRHLYSKHAGECEALFAYDLRSPLFYLVFLKKKHKNCKDIHNSIRLQGRRRWVLQWACVRGCAKNTLRSSPCLMVGELHTGVAAVSNCQLDRTRIDWKARLWPHLFP